MAACRRAYSERNWLTFPRLGTQLLKRTFAVDVERCCPV